MYKIICSLILILLVVPSLPAQEKVSFDTITSRMAEQLNMYPKEKLHVHIDRSCYLRRHFVVQSLHGQCVFSYSHPVEPICICRIGQSGE